MAYNNHSAIIKTFDNFLDLKFKSQLNSYIKHIYNRGLVNV